MNFQRTILFYLIFILSQASVSVVQSSPEDLSRALQEKTNKLKEVGRQLQETQQNLSEKEEQSRSLSQELKKISTNIKQLNLGIESSKVNIDKLGLEVQSLHLDIKNIENKVKQKRDVVVRLLRQLQEKDNETMVMMLFKNKSLSANIAEATNVSAFNADLNDNIIQLKDLQDQLSNKLNQTTKKKKNVELEHQNLTAKKKIVAEKEGERKVLLAQTTQQKKAYEKQLSQLEEQQLAIAEEIEKIESQLRAQSNPNALPAIGSGVLGWPVIGRMSQVWGSTKFARSRNGYRGGWHNGMDISAPFGTPVLAAERGVVLATGDQDQYCRRGAYGKFVVIKHQNNLVTLYTHLSGFNISVGSIVGRGDVIGYLGSTGYSTGPHLHFTVYDASTFGMRSSVSCGPMPSGGDLNPQKYL